MVGGSRVCGKSASQHVQCVDLQFQWSDDVSDAKVKNWVHRIGRLELSHRCPFMVTIGYHVASLSVGQKSVPEMEPWQVITRTKMCGPLVV